MCREQAPEVMGDDRMIRERIEAALDELAMSYRAVSDYKPSTPLLGRARGFFLDELERLLHSIRAREDALGQEALEDSWARLRADLHTARAVTAEALAYLQGAMLREAGVDEGACALADALIDEVAAAADLPVGRCTVPGEQELYDPRSDIIRIRFPTARVWDLPVAVHEFGHFAAARLKDPDLGTTPLATHPAALDRAGRLRRSELIADAFAVHAAGPAYLANAVLTRFSPVDDEAVADSPTHPRHSDRVHVIVRVAGRQVQGAGHPWTWLVEELDGSWHDNLARAGVPSSPQDADRLDALADTVAGFLDRKPSLVYGGWERAHLLALAIGEEGRGRPAADDALTVRDVVNAAWLARLYWPRVAHRISDTCAELVHAITRRRNRGDVWTTPS